MSTPTRLQFFDYFTGAGIQLVAHVNEPESQPFVEVKVMGPQGLEELSEFTMYMHLDGANAGERADRHLLAHEQLKGTEPEEFHSDSVKYDAVICRLRRNREVFSFQIWGDETKLGELVFNVSVEDVFEENAWPFEVQTEGQWSTTLGPKE